jgi:ribonuclease Z
MPKTIILGSSNAVATPASANTHLVFVGQERMVLVDLPGGQPPLRLEQAGLDFNNLTDIIATHFHIDHTQGIPALLMDLWLKGRSRPLNIYGLPATLDRLETMLDLYHWSSWPNLFPVAFCRLPAVEMSLVLDCADFTIHASPVHHVIPNIGLRVQFKPSNQTLAYSCDTEPCDEVVRLSRGADVLIHEATGAYPGHSTAQQAGAIARRAEVGRLYLIHYATGQYAHSDLVAEAGAAFPGEVALATDLMTLDFSSPNSPSALSKGK